MFCDECKKEIEEHKKDICFFCKNEFNLKKRDNSGYRYFFGSYIACCAACFEDYLSNY